MVPSLHPRTAIELEDEPSGWVASKHSGQSLAVLGVKIDVWYSSGISLCKIMPMKNIAHQLIKSYLVH